MNSRKCFRLISNALLELHKDNKIIYLTIVSDILNKEIIIKAMKKNNGDEFRKDHIEFIENHPDWGYKRKQIDLSNKHHVEIYGFFDYIGPFEVSAEMAWIE